MTIFFLLILTAAFLVWSWDYGTWLEQRTATGRTVVVNLTTGESLDGRLVKWRGELAVLAGVTLVTPDGTRHPMDGDALVPRRSISFLQVYGT